MRGGTDEAGMVRGRGVSCTLGKLDHGVVDFCPLFQPSKAQTHIYQNAKPSSWYQ